jgi:hypothetical protein
MVLGFEFRALHLLGRRSYCLSSVAQVRECLSSKCEALSPELRALS